MSTRSLRPHMSLDTSNHFPRPPAAGLLVRIDSRATQGLQQQVYSEVRREILDGVLPPGTRLPSSRALAEDLKVSRTTTLLAYEQLLAEGYLSARHGSGTFVASELPDDFLRQALPRLMARAKHPQPARRGLAPRRTSRARLTAA